MYTLMYPWLLSKIIQNKQSQWGTARRVNLSSNKKMKLNCQTARDLQHRKLLLRERERERDPAGARSEYGLSKCIGVPGGLPGP